MGADLKRPHEGLACNCLVIKVGSALLVGDDGEPRRAWLASLVGDIAALAQRGARPVIVSSGAIALGARRLGLKQGGRGSLTDAQAAASVGQIALSRTWSELLADHGLTAAQMLLTLDDLEDRRRYLNATATLEKLLEKGAVPVINENDSVATDEIRFGDNDRLAARVAQAIGADRLVILSDVDGLYAENPSRNPAATFVPTVPVIDDEILAMADAASSSGLGSGGMRSKLEAAQIANLAGVETLIIQGREDNPLERYRASGVGTLFEASRAENARKSWLGGRLTANGTIQIDAGAASAIRKGGSLLAAGIITIDGQFERSEVVEIRDESDTVIARGLSEYDAIEIAKIMGRRSSEQQALLGYAPRSAVVHRNQLVLV